MDATGRQIDEIDENTAVRLGCLTTLRCLQRRGLLEFEESQCKAAARSGQLEELKVLRAEISRGTNGRARWRQRADT